MRGVALLVETIEKITDRLNPRLQIDGILATMYDGRTLHSREVVKSVVDHFGERVFHTVITRTVKFPDATLAAEPITSYAPAHVAATAYRQLARELIARGDASLTRPRPGCTAARRGADPPWRSHPVRGAPRHLLRSVRPAARADRKHKLDITEIALAKVTDEFIAHIKAAQAADGGLDLARPPSSCSSPRPCSTSRLPGCCRRAGRRTRRTSPSSRLATCSSPGCCSTAPSRTSRAPSPSGWRPRAAWWRARAAWSRSSRAAARAGHGGHPRAAGHDRGPGDGPEDAADRRPGAPARPRGERARAGRHPRSSGCAASGPARSGPWSRTPTPPSSSSPGSSRCSSCSRSRRSPSSRPRPLGELTVRWTGPDEGDIEVSDEFDEQRAQSSRAAPSDPGERR